MEDLPQAQRVLHVKHGERVTRPSEIATRSIRELAERQHGVVSRRQLIAMGLGNGLIQDRVSSGRLIRLHRGVFAVGIAEPGQRGRWIAAVLACGEGAALSHGSAADLWGMRRSRGAVEVMRTSGGRPRVGIRIHQVRELNSFDLTIEMGVPVTTIERTLLDMSARLDQRQLERVVVAADRSRRLRWPELERQVIVGSGRNGVSRLRRVFERVDPRAAETRSGLEVDFLALCREGGLPQAQVNVLVEGYLVDFFWPASRVVVEIDSYTYHRDRPAFESDHERTAALSTAGYAVHRATDRMLVRESAAFLNLVSCSLQVGA